MAVDTADTTETAETSHTAEAEQTSAPRSRRHLLTAALGGLTASIAALVGRPQSARAAAGSALIIGSEANNAGTSNTQLLTNSNVVAFKLLQNGPGTALMGYATPGSGTTRGVYGRTDSPSGFGVEARNNAAAGAGAAIHAIGVNNHGIDASTANTLKYAVTATNSSSSNSGGGAIRADGGQNIGVFAYASGLWQALAAAHIDAGGTAISATGGSSSGIGVVGYGANGVVGYSSAGSYAAIFGQHTATSGIGYGVFGEVESTSAGASGVFGTDSGGTNQTNGVEGVSSSTLGNGVLGTSTVNDVNAYGVYGVGSSAGYGVVANGDLRIVGDLTATGSKAGYVVDVAVNGSRQALRQGDAVTLLGVRAPVLGSIPVLVVGPANGGDAVIGVVDRRVDLTPDPKASDGSRHVKANGTSVEPAEHLYVVTLGSFAVASVDASSGPIKAGSRLSAGANGRLVKAKPIQVSGRSMYPAGEQVGYALGELASGTGKVGIFVSPH